MDSFISKELLKEKAEMFHVKLDEIALDRFDKYGKLLVEWNEKMNLTAITEFEEVLDKHFYDSLLPENIQNINHSVWHISDLQKRKVSYLSCFLCAIERESRLYLLLILKTLFR